MLNLKGAYIGQNISSSVDRRCPDIKKAKKILGYAPVIKWKDGLKITVDWYLEYFKNNPLLNLMIQRIKIN